MDVVLMGNGPFAVPLLERLANGPFRPKLVVTRPDRPQGKKREVILGPVAARATALGFPVSQPEDANSPETIAKLAELSADVFVVADFGQILSSSCLSSARLGGINVHASLLPKYRGAAPVAWAIYHGEKETGVSIIQMTTALDAGGVILSESTPINPLETSEELEARLAILGAALAEQALLLLASGAAKPQLQEAKLATRAPRLKKEDGGIDWSRSAQEIHDQIRAMRPWPIAYTDLVRGDETALRLQLLESQPEVAADSAKNVAPGTIIGGEGTLLRVACGLGVLSISVVKPAGKKEMDAGSFLRGQRLQAGDRFLSKGSVS